MMKGIRLGTGLVVVLALAGFTYCGKSKAAESKSMVVTFTSGDAKIVRAGQEIGIQVGMVVNENDTIKTTDGTVDLQSRGGSAVRISQFTTVTVAKLAGGDNADTKISMKHGGLLASVKKTSAKETFSVVTPTAIAGVRGTTFRVEMEVDKAPRVKVLDGKVAMAPRVAALDSFSNEQIQANPALKQLAEMEKKEVVLDQQTEGTLDAKVQAQVAAVNTTIEASSKDGKVDATKVAEVSKSMEQASTQLAKDTEKPSVSKKDAEITGQDLIDKATLVAVESSVLDKVIEGNKPGAAPTTAVSDELKAKREAKQEQVMKQIQEEASKKKLTNEKEIEQYYNKLETVVLKNGTNHTGAVIAQTGNILMVHTTNGVLQIEKSQVSSIEYR